MDQTSFSSVYLNLDALTSSSKEETLDVKKCEDFAVTIVCNSEEADTHVNSGVQSKRHSAGRPAALQAAGRPDQEDSLVG